MSIKYNKNRNIIKKNGKTFELIICMDCKQEIEIPDPKTRKRKFCDECIAKRRRAETLRYSKNYVKRRKDSKKNKCSKPGCNNFKAKGHVFLCKNCFYKGARDIIFDQHTRVYV